MNAGIDNTTLIPVVTPFFDAESNTFSYVVKDPSSAACAVIDSVLDLDYASGDVSHEGADAIIRFIRDNELKIEWIVETHAHADHISAGHYIRDEIGGKLAIGEQIKTVQKVFGGIYNIDDELAHDGSQFDHLFTDGETYKIGNLEAHVMHTPGHTTACMSHLIGDALFVGDTIFMPDAGTARVDFPGGDAVTLYRSIHKLLELPGKTRVFMCHDYGPNDRELEYETTIAEERARNIHVNDSVNEDEFVRMRTARDKTLGMPHLILPSLQVNVRAGEFPKAEDNGLVYLKIPINAFK
jgi:glyoxylase-like metal-dependent hydrolase (beta-lactamase superfamily II)